MKAIVKSFKIYVNALSAYSSIVCSRLQLTIMWS